MKWRSQAGMPGKGIFMRVLGQVACRMNVIRVGTARAERVEARSAFHSAGRTASNNRIRHEKRAGWIAPTGPF